jgi:uncharacterized protein involved in outer membrane biogenesis
VTDFFTLAPWINWRRRRFWAVVVLLVYTLAGFFLVPWVARVQIVEQVSAALSLPVKLNEFRFNPWTLRAEATGFAIGETDGTRIVGFERLVVDLQVSSLFRFALTFREVTLDKPFGRLTRQPDGSLNVDPLIAAASGEPAAPIPAADKGGPLRLLISALSIVDGRIETRDETLATPFTAVVGPIDINVNDLTTLPDRAGLQRVSVATESGTQLEWSGSLELEPLISEGSVIGSGPYLPLIYQYFQDQLNFELTEGAVELSFDYRLELDPAAGAAVDLSNVNTTLRGATLQFNEVDGSATRFVTLPIMRMVNGQLAWPAQTVSIDAFEIENADVALWSDADGGLNLERLLVTPPPATAADAVEVATPVAAADDAAPWDLSLNAFRIDNLTLTYSDRGLPDENAVVARNVRLDVQNISNQPGQSLPIELALTLDGGGDIALTGQAQALPTPAFQAKLEVSELALAIAQPWLAAVVPLEVDGGALDLTVNLRSDADEAFAADGAITLRDLAVSDTLADEKLIGWQRMAIDQFVFSTNDQSLTVSQVAFAAPFARVRIEADNTTNFESLLANDAAADVAAASPPAEEVAAPAEPLAITVGEVVVTDGSIDFTDLALPLPFAAKIADLGGEITTLSTVSTEPTRIGLAGKVGEYGLAEIEGRVLAADPATLTDIDVRFRNIEMPTLSPYTAKFAGRAIEAGRIDVELGYTIEENRLQGENSIVMRELQLGDKIDSPDAANLPLGLAVALLTGPDGTITIDLPVSGNVDDPDFSVGGVAMKAFVTLVSKLATSPFRLLGNLVGVESDDFGQVEFRAGEAELTPPEQEKLARLAEALVLRPSLGLGISGVSAPGADTAALKRARVDVAIDAQVSAAGGIDEDKAELLTKRRRKAVEGLVKAAVPDVDLAAERAANQRPVDATQPDGRQTLDEPAYIAALETRLIAAEPITPTDLDGLATARAQAVSLALGAGTQLEASRVTLADPATVEADESGWVLMELDVTSGE